MNEILRPFDIDFDLTTGLSRLKKASKRYLSNMADMFYDTEKAGDILKNEDPLIYEFYEMGIPETVGDIAFGTSIVYPGKIGNEYFMTKGHFHTVLETAEVYFCIKGKGYMLMETPEGQWDAQEFAPGKAVYVPKRWAHRSINVSPTEPLITFFAFRADAGHDYGTIETKGFRKLIVEKDGRPVVIDNPRWS
ncbi:MAG: glucose-6-phosphate isomerase, archaeal [Thermoanaerobacteraceae bacterium]|uniref:glucose-6-phosphate isomerase n=2 Tax=Biomaibacter acetigenes TaxID=2316383 RepID=A0A3G2R369_9FIRM|nr:glucose-6-phosphate isomerase [Biomaibacter acetigenes]AYO29799.1 glucose-6-phosphate isomerase [Biomaibacter acetigenes]MDK2878302.1 glucose-6-phosphate isomerase, archaeal [Thermoanaerobacteraceae bacterium]MDN5311339.1 glucose-6-phosphate isomerase, archaeal [Thermoanaerobacteraceae bacterium]RKL64450.1 glucose-6-phosphate isomerase [Thermoanaerobacteraceae bacterium SP2]